MLLQDIASANSANSANPWKAPNSSLIRYACQTLPNILVAPFHGDVRSVKDARSSYLQRLAMGTVASGLSRLVQRCPALGLHEGTFFLPYPAILCLDHVFIGEMLIQSIPIPSITNRQESIAFIWHPRLYFDVELKSIVTR